MGWREGKGGKRIEEGKERERRGRNVAFHHLLLSNLTTDCKAAVKVQAEG